MTIGGISTNPPALSTGTDNSVARQRFSDAFEAVASKLGMSKSDLISDLQSGQTMAQIAQSKGVSEQDVISAAASALQQADPSLSADAAQKLATSFYDGKVGHAHHHHSHGASAQTIDATQPQLQPAAPADPQATTQPNIVDLFS
jgi:hypothetical protein